MKTIVKIEELVRGSVKIRGLTLEILGNPARLLGELEAAVAEPAAERRLSRSPKKWRTEYKLGLTAGGVFTAVDGKSVVSFTVRKHKNKTAFDKFLAGSKSDLAKKVLADFNRSGYGRKLQAARMQYARTSK